MRDKDDSPPTTNKPNCWEFKKCGREAGGPKAAALGVCPAASTQAVDGLNHGKAGGRVCWAIAGTLCGGVVQGTFAQKLGSCLACEFYRGVVKEERRGLATAREIHDRLDAAAALTQSGSYPAASPADAQGAAPSSSATGSSRKT